MAEEPQRLFLLEFLVEEVDICKTKSLINRVGDDQSWLEGQTCVAFQFLSFPFLEVCEKDFTPCKTSDANAEFRSGKSCMFALSPELMDQCQTDFPINVAVNRKMAPGVLPETFLVGECEIPLQEHFTELVTKACGCETDVDATVSKTIKDSYAILIAGTCKQVGEISVFIRLSCFGKVIVTQFQMNSEKQSYLFKGNEDEAVYQCKKMEVGEKDCGCTGLIDPDTVEPPQPTMCQQAAMMGGGMGGGMGGRMGGGNPYGNQYPMQQYGQASQGGYGQYGAGQCGQQPQMEGYPGPMGEGSEEPADKNFEEIGAEVNGHSLKIRVPKKKKASKEGQPDQLLEGGYSPCPGMPPGMNWGGGMPGYGAMGGYGMGAQQQKTTSHCGSNTPCSKKDQNMGGYGPPNGGVPSPYPAPPGSRPLGSVGVDGKEITFSMPSGPANCAQLPALRYRMSGMEAPGCGRVIKVEPEQEKAGATTAELTDPDSKDVFVLRIGKQTDGPEKRARLELELKTPKRVDPNACQNTASHDTQYLASDCSPDGGGKGKKGKGGKGGKGGKKGKGKK